MIIIDQALEERHRSGRPIRVGMVGAGFLGRAIALQMLTVVRGVQLVAISNRHIERAHAAYAEAGVDDVHEVEAVAQLEKTIGRGGYAVTDDALLLCEAKGIDVILDVTGAVEFGARVTLAAIQHGKHVVLMNAELDGTVGPILKVHADRADVILTNCDGDQPAVQMNLVRFVRGMGMRPVLCGNVKGMQDRYRTPTTQEAFARKWGQSVHMVTSAADGTKISFEQAIVANATGMRVGIRGMFGPVAPGARVEDAPTWYPAEALLEGPGIVDYVVGALPSPAVYVLATQDDPRQRFLLDLYKQGPGPFYTFYMPYHLCHFEAHNSIARAVLFGDAALAPLGPPCVDVVAVAKTDLHAGTRLDGMGGYTLYGLCENNDVVRAENLLPIGLAEDAVLRRGVAKDSALTYDDVGLPGGRLCDELRAEQDAHFA